METGHSMAVGPTTGAFGAAALASRTGAGGRPSVLLSSFDKGFAANIINIRLVWFIKLCQLGFFKKVITTIILYVCFSLFFHLNCHKVNLVLINN